PGSFSARLDCANSHLVRGAGDVTVTSPQSRETIVNATLFVRGSEPDDEWVKATKDVLPAPSTTFTYFADLGRDVLYLSTIDAHLVVGSDPEPEDPDDLLAAWSSVVVRAAEGCGTTVQAAFGPVSRQCTDPGVLSGTVTIT